MISIIIFLVCFLGGLVLNICLYSQQMWQISLIFLFNVILVFAVNGIIAIVVCKLLPNKWFEGRFFTPTKQEILFYKHLRIKAWKDRILELGALNGFRKNHLSQPTSIEYLQKFILESNKGFLTHFASIFLAILPLFFIPIHYWASLFPPIILANFILNFMPMAVLRYNIPRLKVALKFATRQTKED